MAEHTELNRIRARIEAANSLVEALRNPIPTKAIVRQRAEAEVQAIATEVRNRVLLGGCGASNEHFQPGRAGDAVCKLGAAQLMAIMNPKALIDLLVAESELEASGGDPQFRLDPIEAAERLAQVEAERIRLEIEEELLLRATEDAGHTTFRRADASPAALLASTVELRAFIATAKAA